MQCQGKTSSPSARVAADPCENKIAKQNFIEAFSKHPWNFLLKFSWNTLNTFLKYPWNFLKKSLKLPWIILKVSGNLLNLPSTPLKSSLKQPWNIFETFPQTLIELLLNAVESHLKVHWNTLKSSLKHPQIFLQTPLNFPWNTLKTSLKDP